MDKYRKPVEEHGITLEASNNLKKFHQGAINGIHHLLYCKRFHLEDHSKVLEIPDKNLKIPSEELKFVNNFFKHSPAFSLRRSSKYSVND